jgi:hypothetical protein
MIPPSDTYRLERMLLQQWREFLRLGFRAKLRLLRTILFPSCAFMRWQYGPCSTCRCWKLHLKRWKMLARLALAAVVVR